MLLYSRSSCFHERSIWHTGECSSILLEGIKGSDTNTRRKEVREWSSAPSEVSGSHGRSYPSNGWQLKMLCMQN